MLQLLDESIEALLRAEVPLPAGQVAVSFEPPDREWGAGISQPTVNIYLWGIERDTDRQRAGMESVQRDGKTVRRRPDPWVQVRYLVTVWTTSHRDEHQLLGELMRAVLAARHISPPYLLSPLDQVQPYPSIELGSGGRSPTELSRALDGQLKPGLEVVVGLPLDLGLLTATARPPAEISVSTSDTNQPSRTSTAERPVLPDGRPETP